MKLPRILISAVSSGSGKTTFTCGLLEVLKRHNLSVSAFKCGPDYIDPMFHRTVLDLPSKNLDSFFADKNTLLYLFAESAVKADISVIEGVMGYYDGLGFDTVRASSYEVAKDLKTPVILILNAKGMALSAVAAIKGFLELEEKPQIKGVVLNRVTKMTYMQLAPVIEERLGIRVLGFLPPMPDCQIESRHLGLVTPKELADIKSKICKIADLIEENVNVDLLLEIAGEANELEETNIMLDNELIDIDCECNDKYYNKVKIAVAYDKAFCFYYEDNLNLLRKLGAELQFFSPMYDDKLPENCSGILLGGGYPELYADILSNNRCMLKEIKSAYDNNMPIIAECGGFLYLHKQIEDLDHKLYDMAGVIDSKAVYTGKLSRFGYIDINLKNKQMYGDKGEVIRGHEFHYYESESNGCCAKAVKPSGKREWECMHGNNFFEAGFPHLYYYSNIKFAMNYVNSCREYNEKYCKML